MFPENIIRSREIGSLIKKRRVEIGLTQEKLAEDLKVSYQQVQRYENGSNRLNVENLQVIARILAVPVSFFFEKSSEETVDDEGGIFLSTEETKLITTFKRIKAKENKQVVLKVAELAAD